MRKGQVQPVSVILIIVISLGAIATVLPWANTMIQKRKDSKSVDDVFNFFMSLDRSIREIAESGGEETISLKVPGRFTIYPETVTSPSNNSIVFVFESKISNVAEGDWVPLNNPNVNSTAVLSVDTPSVVFARAVDSSDNLDVYYRLWYRRLIDPVSNQGYWIVLNTTDNTVKETTTGFMRIQRIGSRQAQGLTITEINIIV